MSLSALEIAYSNVTDKMSALALRGAAHFYGRHTLDKQI